MTILFFYLIIITTSGGTAIRRDVEIIREPDRAVAVLHPLRRRILALLSEPAGAATLARRLGLPRQRLNYHLRALEKAGVIEVKGTRKVRGCTERLLQRRSRQVLLHPFLLDPKSLRPGTHIDPRSWAYLRSRVLRVLRDISLAEEHSPRKPLALEASVGFANERSREKFETALGKSFRELAVRFGDGSQTARYLLLGLPSDEEDGKIDK